MRACVRALSKQNHLKTFKNSAEKKRISINHSTMIFPTFCLHQMWKQYVFKWKKQKKVIIFFVEVRPSSSPPPSPLILFNFVALLNSWSLTLVFIVIKFVFVAIAMHAKFLLKIFFFFILKLYRIIIEFVADSQSLECGIWMWRKNECKKKDRN